MDEFEEQETVLRLPKLNPKDAVRSLISNEFRLGDMAPPWSDDPSDPLNSSDLDILRSIRSRRVSMARGLSRNGAAKLSHMVLVACLPACWVDR